MVTCCLLVLATAVLGWQRDISLENVSSGCTPETFINCGPVVADVVPSWPGKEILQVTYYSLKIIKADNSEMINLEIPDIQPNPTMSGYTPLCDPQTREMISGPPAVGDVDNDGFNEIIVGISNEFILDANLPGVVHIGKYFSTVVWWDYVPQSNPPQFEMHYFDMSELQPEVEASFGTPVVCRTGFGDSPYCVVFFGPSRYLFEGSGHTHLPWRVTYKLVSFDLSNPNQVEYDEHTLPYWEDPSGIGTAQALKNQMHIAQTADVTGDGLDEVFVHNIQYAYALQWDDGWTPLPGFGDLLGRYNLWLDFDNWAFCTGSFSLADIDGDRSIDILAPIDYRNNGIFQSKLIRLDLNGQHAGTFSNPEENWNEMTVVGVADWSAIFPSQGNANLNPVWQALSGTKNYTPQGTQINNFPRLWQSLERTNISSPAVGDIIGAGWAQFLDPTIGRQVIGTNELCAYHPADPVNPVLMTNLDVSYYSTEPNPSTPAIADVNHDGIADVVVAYRTNSENIRVFSVECPASHNPELTEWSQFQNGPRHTGLYAQPVSGVQPRDVMKWSGRIIVHGYYQVNADQTLIIEPGTVVEFRDNPGASLYVYGTLQAEGSAYDSIYFKSDGAGQWGGIYCIDSPSSRFINCVIHDGDVIYTDHGMDFLIEQCHIYNMNIGLDVTNSRGGDTHVRNSLIEDCSLYGVRGTLSAGIFTTNVIRNCDRAGIYWIGDRSSTAEPPIFEYNTVEANGDGGSPVAGGYFSSTQAHISCNTFINNYPYQIFCENAGNVVLNGDYVGNRGTNILRRDGVCNVSCIVCDPRCETCTMPRDHYPLLKIFESYPALRQGYNTFWYEPNDGVYISDASLLCDPFVHDIDQNYYYPNNSGPYQGNFHYCPDINYSDPSPLAFGPVCGIPIGHLALEGGLALYQSAAIADSQADYSTASSLFKSVMEQYPNSSEALWAARNYLRTSLAAREQPTSVYDTLITFGLTETLPVQGRTTARKEAIWALIAGNAFTEARTEIADVLSSDSL